MNAIIFVDLLQTKKKILTVAILIISKICVKQKQKKKKGREYLDWILYKWKNWACKGRESNTGLLIEELVRHFEYATSRWASAHITSNQTSSLDHQCIVISITYLLLFFAFFSLVFWIFCSIGKMCVEKSIKKRKYLTFCI